MLHAIRIPRNIDQVLICTCLQEQRMSTFPSMFSVSCMPTSLNLAPGCVHVCYSKTLASHSHRRYCSPPRYLVSPAQSVEIRSSAFALVISIHKLEPRLGGGKAFSSCIQCIVWNNTMSVLTRLSGDDVHWGRTPIQLESDMTGLYVEALLLLLCLCVLFSV